MKVNREILCKILNKCGVSNKVTNYLKDRTQNVNISEVKSSQKLINVGFPQGSILGALLFLIYIKDLSTIQLTGLIPFCMLMIQLFWLPVLTIEI